LITAGRTEELDAMLARFEEQYEAHTARLARLMSRQRDRRTAVYEFAEIASCRKALAETARMLQRAADRDFGRCLHCAADIPVERLTARPEARFCSGCEDKAVPA
jgi:RNA polymerase-binding transcription factor DksA